MISAEVLIVDYGMGNLYSVKRALEECKVQKVVISNKKEDFLTCTHMILPGVGAFGDAMQNIHELGLYDLIRENVLNDKVPFLGICLGMQLMATRGTEYGSHEGLGLIDGEVLRLEKNGKSERIPHVGWNEIKKTQQNNPLLNNIGENSDFYFVHSYHFSAKNQDNVIASTPYSHGFTSMVAKEHIFGVQFHPEKSGKNGFQLLKNFLNIN